MERGGREQQMRKEKRGEMTELEKWREGDEKEGELRSERNRSGVRRE